MGHGFFVPVIAAYIAWQKRDELLGREAKPNYLGLVIVIFAAIQMYIGTLGAELFLARTAFVEAVVGMVLVLGGTYALRVMAFPLLLLCFMVPLPAVIYNQITFPLQIFASQVAAFVLELVGIPVLRDGNVLELPSQKLNVVEACSGIRSLLSLRSFRWFTAIFSKRSPGCGSPCSWLPCRSRSLRTRARDTHRHHERDQSRPCARVGPYSLRLGDFHDRARNDGCDSSSDQSDVINCSNDVLPRRRGRQCLIPDFFGATGGESSDCRFAAAGRLGVRFHRKEKIPQNRPLSQVPSQFGLLEPSAGRCRRKGSSGRPESGRIADAFLRQHGAEESARTCS